ncbi:hypothetical protein Y032_0070g466 [Ancylostoma ceylanicum]|uniref:Uncharacterized protein n=1 Tax=Ancylostoma ceylanicum TaxID=53326 RepID=A0A016TWU1_9BILA|nr:hypothetical protein Y032_0070g466 [Ancylostoma ceylanicum]
MVVLAPLIILKLVLLVLLLVTIRFLRKNYKPSRRLLGGKPTSRTKIPAPDKSTLSSYTHQQTTVTMDLWDDIQKPESKIKSLSKESVKCSPGKNPKTKNGAKKKKKKKK